MSSSRVTFAALILVLCIALPVAQAQMGGGNMGRGMSGMMLLSGGQPYRIDGAMLQMDDAIQIAQRYLLTIRSSNLALDEIEEWEFNYYVIVKEASPSNYKAFQLVIDKWTGYVMPEPGANMLWNIKYGGMMTGGRMGGGGGMGRPSTAAIISPAAAEKAANDFLRQRLNRGRTLVAQAGPDNFYGFYGFDVKDAKTGAKYGMLSVNSRTGQVWYHTWHGRYITGRELG